MKLRVLDAPTLNSLDINDVASWLRAGGWELASQSERSFRFTREVDGETAEVEVPRRREFRDFALRMGEVLHTIAEVEQRSEPELIAEIRRTQVDVLRFRLHGAVLADGRVPAGVGVELYRGVRDLLLAGACAAIERRAVFARRKPDKAMRFLDTARLAPPEPGSFVVVVESPLPPVLQRSLFRDTDPEPPFGRRVMSTLATAMAEAKRAAEEARATESLDPFERAISQGVSANLVEALAGVLELTEDTTIEARFSWAPKQPAPGELLSTVRLTRDFAPVMRSAAEGFRAREPMYAFELSGPILELKSEDADRGGTIVVAGALDQRVVRVLVEVDAAQYEQALQAHKHKAAVGIEGELRREGRRYVLNNPRHFAILSDDALEEPT